MANRTVIEAMPDNHIAVTHEAPRGVPGSSHDRRKAKKRETHSAWRKLSRKVFRHGSIEAYAEAGIACLPGDPEIAKQTQKNIELANFWGYKAEQVVANNERKAAQFAVSPPRKIRVTITVEDEP